MKNRILVKTSVILALVGFVIGVGSSSSQAYIADCVNDEKTNKAIVEAIYAKIKDNKNLASQISRINVTSTNLAVKIVGWTDKKSDYDKVVQFALDAKCVRVVNVNDFHEQEPSGDSFIKSSGGCSGGTKQCGDICIPKNDVCNITGFKN